MADVRRRVIVSGNPEYIALHLQYLKSSDPRLTQRAERDGEIIGFRLNGADQEVKRDGEIDQLELAKAGLRKFIPKIFNDEVGWGPKKPMDIAIILLGQYHRSGYQTINESKFKDGIEQGFWGQLHYDFPVYGPPIKPHKKHH